MRNYIGIFFFICSSLWAESVWLVNDSAVPLKAVVRAADGTDLGTLEIPAQNTMQWSNYLGGVGNIQYNSVSQTPYTVVWFCNNEDDETPFSICSQVSSGSTVTALSCDGKKACQLPKKKKQNNYPAPPPTPQQQQQQQTEQSAGPPEGALQ